MDILHFDRSKQYGHFKVLNAVNNGPHHRRHAKDQYRSNLEAYKAARIPYARNHDASFYWAYGREHTVDISAIFPNFDADAYDPASYDFTCTDEYTEVTALAGTETFFRLGQTIEHYIKKFHIYPPADFKKWAVICEHIIRHYNEGWANGYHLDIQYWEIWNEPDLDEDSDYRRTWAGTRAEFFDLYEVAAKHLKSCFPNLKIGGPALAGNLEWAEEFLKEMQRRNVPLDFFSWHRYCTDVKKITDKAAAIDALLERYGYQNAESILNEWNYWYRSESEDAFVHTIDMIKGIKGAAFIMAVMSAAQPSSIDMLMYYDARPTEFNGLFQTDTLRPLKGYYPFLWYGNFYDLVAEIRCESSVEDIYTLCGVDGDGKVTAVLTYYTEADSTSSEKTVSLDFGRDGTYEIYLLDRDHDGEPIETVRDLTFTLKPLTCILIKEK